MNAVLDQCLPKWLIRHIGRSRKDTGWVSVCSLKEDRFLGQGESQCAKSLNKNNFFFLKKGQV